MITPITVPGIITPRRTEPKRETYGLEWSDEEHGQFIDQVMYRDAARREEAGTEQWRHLQRLLEWRYPYGDRGFQMHWFVDELCWAWCNSRVVIVGGSGGSGKSETFGAIAWEELDCYRGKYSCMMVSTSVEALKKRMFGAAAKACRRAMKADPIGTDWLKIYDSAGVGRIVAKPDYLAASGDKEAGIFCIAIEKGDSDEKIKNNLGFHNAHTRMMVDEANARAIEGVFKGYDNLDMTGHAKLGCAYNPDNWTSRVGKMSVPKDGTTQDAEYLILNADLDEPECIKWECRDDEGWGRTLFLHLDARRNNAVLHPDGPEAGAKEFGRWMTTKAIIDRKMPGGIPTKANHYIQIIACPPPEGLFNVVISPKDFQVGLASAAPPTWLTRTMSLTAGDPNADGRDNAYLMEADIGTGLVDGGERMVIHIKAQKALDFDVGADESHSRLLAKAYAASIMKSGGSKYGCFDATGMQRAMSDMIEEECGKGIYRCSASEDPGIKEAGRKRYRSNKKGGFREKDFVKLGNDGMIAKKEYKDWPSYAYGLAAMFIRAGHVRGLGSDAERQLTTRQVESMAPMKIQTKKSWSSTESPDAADTFAMICVMLVERFGILPQGRGVPTALQKGWITSEQAMEEVNEWLGITQPARKSARPSKSYPRSRARRGIRRGF